MKFLTRTVAAVGLALALPLAALAQSTTAPNTLVRLSTAEGPIDIVLLNSEAPVTVTNFLSYVRRGDYNRSFFHRLVPGFVMQGGGYTAPPIAKVPAQPAIVNEFSATRSNVRGTVAMAKLGGNPNSATSEWFVNLANNAANLDAQNGGFTVFGRVTAPSMAIVDRLATSRLVDASGCGPALSAFGSLPVLRSISNCTQVAPENLLMVAFAAELTSRATASPAERIFDYVEAAFPQYAKPASPATLTADGYTYRFYSATNAYLGVKDGKVFYLVPSLSPDIQLLGTVDEWLAIAQGAGY